MLVCLKDASDPGKQARSEAWLKAISLHGDPVVSPQVIHEVVRVLTRRVRDPALLAQAREFARAFLPWCDASLDRRTSEAALDLHARHHLGWWDCVLVASALQAGADYLLSEDLQAGRAFGRLQIVNPFRIAPETFLAGVAGRP